MKGWLAMIGFILVVISSNRDYRKNKIIEEFTNAQPGLHIPQSLPGTHIYISKEMYDFIGDTSISVTVVHDVPLAYGIAGLTQYINHGTYLILLRWPSSNEQSDYTLLHEWGHVIQMHSGDLVEGPIVWTWKGDVVDFSMPWSIRPWEIQADSLATYHQNRLLPWRQYEPLR